MATSYPPIETIDADSIKDLSDADLGALTLDLIHTMGEHAGNGLFEGALEMMDAASIVHLRNSLWEHASSAPSDRKVTVDLIDRIEDHELQELTAAVLTAASQKDVLHVTAHLPDDEAEEIAMMIEDWETRYQFEDDTGFQ